MSLVDVIKLFPTDKAAEKWLIEQRWPEGVECPHCGSKRIHHNAKHKTMSMRCKDCRKWFSVKTGTAMQGSKLGYQKWVLAFYQMATGIKGVSSMKLHRDLGITQKSAWFLAHRIRECWDTDKEKFGGPVEADETYFGGKRKNMPKSKREKLTGRGPVGKTAVVGVKDRETKQVAAKVALKTNSETIQGFVNSKMKQDAKLYTDDHRAYSGMPREVVKHSIGEFVSGKAHANGIESFWSMMKRGYYGTYHKMSPAHLNRYVNEFAGRHNDRPSDTIDQLSAMANGLTGKRLTYQKLIS